jgi:hypothetical protein
VEIVKGDRQMKTGLFVLLAAVVLLAACDGAAMVTTAPPATATSVTSTTPVATATLVPAPTSAPTDTPLPASPTSAPTASASDTTPTAVPSVSQSPKSLEEYAITIKDILQAGSEAIRRDTPLLVAAGIIPRAVLGKSDSDLLGGIELPTTQDPTAACGGAQTPHSTLVADAALMQNLAKQLRAIKPPAEGADWVHKPLLNGVEKWGKALDKVNASCATTTAAARERLRGEATLGLGEAYVNVTVAAMAAIQIIEWTGLADAAEAASGEELFGQDASGDWSCAEPDIYRPQAELAGAALANADLSNCQLTNANLRGADLTSAMLDNTSLAGADLRDAKLTNATLDGANLAGARLNGADLRNAVLDTVVLAGADLSGADLRNAILSGADLDGAIWDNTVCPDGTNSNTNGLNACASE